MIGLCESAGECCGVVDTGYSKYIIDTKNICLPTWYIFVGKFMGGSDGTRALMALIVFYNLKIKNLR